VLKRATKITLLSLLARAMQLLFFLVIGNFYGASTFTDTVLLYQAPILVTIAVMIGVTDVVIMPTMHKAVDSRCSREVYKSLLLYTQIAAIPLAIVASLVGIAITPEASFEIVVLLFFMPFLASASGFYFGLLNANDKYNVATLGPLYGGIGASIILLCLPISTTALAVSLLAFEIFKLAGLKFHSRHIFKSLSVNSENPSELLISVKRIAKIQAIGSFIVALNPFIDDLFAINIGNGAVSLVEYASRLWNIVPLLLAGNIMIFFSNISKSAAQNSLNINQVHFAALAVGLIGVVISILIAVASPYIISSIYGFGKMTISTLENLSSLFRMFLLGAGIFAAGQIYVKAFSAMRHTTPLTIIAVLTILMNIIGNYIFIALFGLKGIGLATSIAYTFSTILLGFTFHFYMLKIQSNMSN